MNVPSMTTGSPQMDFVAFLKSKGFATKIPDRKPAMPLEMRGYTRPYWMATPKYTFRQETPSLTSAPLKPCSHGTTLMIVRLVLILALAAQGATLYYIFKNIADLKKNSKTVPTDLLYVRDLIIASTALTALAIIVSFFF